MTTLEENVTARLQGTYRDDNFGCLAGRVLKDVFVDGDDEILFTMEGGDQYKLYHERDCCEMVSIEDICGHWDDLIGQRLLVAEESHSDPDFESPTDRDYEPESETWTFYRLGSAKGFVTIRWYGTSNGYYSETVDFEKVK